MAQSVSGVTVRSADGSDRSLGDYAGNVLLIVNVASRCGFTKQYAGLEALNQSYGGQGLKVLGFPCNDFGAQEPGTSEEIIVFCTTTYDVSFPLTQKIDVNGPGQHPIYKWFQEEFPGDIEWNFEKFLINKKGEVIKRYPPQTTPDDAVLMQDIADAL